jgi:hypothetical protein
MLISNNLKVYKLYILGLCHYHYLRHFWVRQLVDLEVLFDALTTAVRTSGTDLLLMLVLS